MTQQTLFDFPAPVKAGDLRALGNLYGSSLALSIAQAAKLQRPILLIVADNQQAQKLQYEIAQFTALSCQVLPDWETLPYDNFSPHQDIISSRIACLYQLPQQTAGVLIVSVSSLMQRLAPTSFLLQHALLVNKGDKFSLEKLREQLVFSGYQHVEQVLTHGEFATRGSIIDLFPMGVERPYRLDFFDDEIDSIREFDPDNQRSTTPIAQINLLPAHEFPTDDAAIEHFRLAFREQFEARREPESIYQQVSKKTWPAGIEYWLPLFFTRTDTLFDYLPSNTLLLSVGELEQAATQFMQDIEARYDQRRVDPLRPLLAPNQLWLGVDALFHQFKHWPRVHLSQAVIGEKAGRSNALMSALPDIRLNQQRKEPLGALRQFIEQFCAAPQAKVVFSVESEGRREALRDLLARAKINPVVSTSLEEALTSAHSLCLILGAADQGFISEHPAFALICESDLLGERVVSQRRRNKQKEVTSTDALFRNLAELQPGQAVVHIEHGIGRYQGLQTLSAGGMENEYLTLMYHGGATLYVPVASLHLISRYSGGDEQAPLNKLGSDAWEKTRKKAAEKVRDVAAELLDIYAKRAIKTGFAFVKDKPAYQDFCQGFAFEETPDQYNAIHAVLNDMYQPLAMDRLVCGDVGFGKTEVAMRAAFVAVNNHKQVAILVPTTLLAQQHFENFRDRFANFAVRVEVLSRFKSAKEQKAILAECAEGKIDILIGTHKLLQSDVQFSDLGLLIVDEEHRFGVRQKEKVKAMRANIDILTLTATPIPRTLNMAMSGMRDLSIIATPPSRRLAIKTFVRERDDALIREALLREIMRGGQVYFLHNNVDTIEKTADHLATLVPEARITVAHGQMRERELERIMSDFYHQRFNVLVSTTIIETGIDVPTANTIIMDRADNLGLAQLHQLRGRVGRSHHQAYAYLLTPHRKRMSKDAIKRLDAITSLEDLGAGFTLATHDLEIRGAGELLGEEQSGQIHSIGFSLYMDMLEQAVNAIKSGKEPSLELLFAEQTEVELRLPALFPESYIPDVNTRLSLYKRVASCKVADEIDELQVELIDRFGILPQAAKDLLAIQQIKIQANQLGIKKIEAHEKGGSIEFSAQSQIDPVFLVSLLQSDPSRYRFDGPTRLKFVESLTDRRDRIKFIESLLIDFSNNVSAV